MAHSSSQIFEILEQEYSFLKKSQADSMEQAAVEFVFKNMLTARVLDLWISCCSQKRVWRKCSLCNSVSRL